MGGLANLAGGKMEQEMKRNPQAMMKNLQKNMDPKMLQSMGGMENVMNMAKQFGGGGGLGGGGGGGMPDMGSAMKMLQGMMGGGGRGGGGMMPDLGAMMNQMMGAQGGGDGEGGNPMEMMQKMMQGGGMMRPPPGMGGKGMRMMKRR